MFKLIVHFQEKCSQLAYDSFVTYGAIYTVFHKKDPFYFSHNSLKWWSIYTEFLSVVAEEILI